jgi:CheY-like chemotaxis protein
LTNKSKTFGKFSQSPIPFTLHLEVEDSGYGIAQSDLENIFEAFMQTERGRHATGTGLGLSISRHFARLMSGDITVNSTLNAGSTFTCEVLLSLLNMVDIVPEKTHIVIGLELGQPTYSILVAEDKLENRQLLMKLLASVGFKVYEAENGLEAIAQWQNYRPDLILMDIQMPLMDGHEATRQIRIRELDQGNKVIIIALTAYAFAEDYTASIQAGCNDHINKPFVETILFDKIAQHLGVRYFYDKKAAADSIQQCSRTRSLTPADLQIMSSEWICQCHQAALDLNDAKLYSLIKEIPEEESALVHDLLCLVNNFHLEAIAALTEI